MLPSLATAAGIYKVNAHLFLMAVEDIRQEHLSVRPNGAANSMHFVAGHMTALRYDLLKLLGGREMPAWHDLFDRGVTVTDTSGYPPVSQIIESWKAADEVLTERLEATTEEWLQAKSPIKPPAFGDTVLGAVNFLAFHETYHTGQLAYIRRLLGYSQLVG